eukprot:SAG11_NODE_259_length_11534_cov_3.402361_4_plen_100_part_00
MSGKLLEAHSAVLTHASISTASDNLLSLSARSSGGHRSLHSHKRSPSKLEKRLLTPERRKKSAEQTLREQIEKQERAERLRQAPSLLCAPYVRVMLNLV